MSIVKFSFLALVAGGLCMLLGVGIWLGPQETACQAEPAESVSLPADPPCEGACGTSCPLAGNACPSTADYAAPVAVATSLCRDGACGDAAPVVAATNSYGAPALPCQTQVAPVVQVSAAVPAIPSLTAAVPVVAGWQASEPCPQCVPGVAIGYDPASYAPPAPGCATGYCTSPSPVGLPYPGAAYPSHPLPPSYFASAAPPSYEASPAETVNEANLEYIQQMFEERESRFTALMEAKDALYETKIEAIQKAHELQLEAKAAVSELQMEAMERIQHLEQALREDKALLHLVADGYLTPEALRKLLDRDAANDGPSHANLTQVRECIGGECPVAVSADCKCGKCGCESCVCGVGTSCACKACKCEACACPGCTTMAIHAPAACEQAACANCPCDATTVAACKGCEGPAFDDVEAFIGAESAKACEGACAKAACATCPVGKCDACEKPVGACPACEKAISTEAPACSGEACPAKCSGDACPISTEACKACPASDVKACPGDADQAACAKPGEIRLETEQLVLDHGSCTVTVEARGVPFLTQLPYLGRLFVNPVEATETVETIEVETAPIVE